ncbi:MAG: thioesterase family protein [Gordonia sp.]|jgi:hypothetical protein|uniref:acyl-CoA thioesterase domain-containing protein n=1 Tax=Gordonia sp. (in: high G+C Gram-positive bacteria) TaxID=84139 RepID=UPI001D831C17|nr:acyl-CoA thioesterase domain-containing protein [Gordonia sp. (in: high G+C Gram-positive bacteria)]MCB1296495.1 thioesterase family protein [Gordonia sp. (in: high G+C Gram-positive bacteria)]HQV17537.1 thioesterase family protein [Gordonia sp. (in: high G+C Gram-positive bacteria)]
MTDGPVLAFFTEDSGRFLPLPLARSLWAADSLTGPAVCGIAARAAETVYGETGFRPVRFTVDLFKMARALPTRTIGRVLRDGGRIRVVEVDVVQDKPSGESTEEVVVARSTTVFLRESANPPGERWFNPADDIVAADTPTPQQQEAASNEFNGEGPWDPALAPWFYSGGTWSNDMGTNQTDGQKAVWSRSAQVIEGEPPSPFQRTVMAAEATSLMGNWGTEGIAFINCDLTVALSRLPGDSRIHVRAESHTEHDGISTSSTGLYDADGRFGTGLVTAVNNVAAQIDFAKVDMTGHYAES